MTTFAEGAEDGHELAPKAAELPQNLAWRVINREPGQPEFVPPRFDPVNRPSHYASGRVECIDAIREALGDEAFVAYCRGNAIKYAWRSGKKAAHAQDLRKAAWYLERGASVLEEQADA